VSGIIVDARSGQQLEGEVRLRSLTSDRASDTSSIAGIFSFRGLPPDRYDITARTPDGLVGSVRDVKIDVGARERLRIEVDTGAVLDLVAVETDTTLRVVDLAGRTVCEFFAEFAGSTFSCVLEPGSCIVRRERNEKVLDEVKLTLRRGERRKLAPGEATD
jgi:hypothetical protein